MNTVNHTTKGWGLRRAALVLAVALPLAGCDGLLEVTDPDIVTPDNLEDALGLQTLRNGAIGLATRAISGSGSGDGINMLGGLMSDEWMHSGTFTTRFRVETRLITRDNGSVPYRRLHSARQASEDAAAKLALGTDAGTDERIGEMHAIAGFVYIAFAESFCSGVPFSEELDDGTFEFGAPETTDQVYDRAIARFTSALAAPISADMADAARVGMGRALLDKGDFAGAAAAVASVADGAAKFWRHSTTAQRSQIFTFNVTVGRWSLGDGEGVNGLDFRTAGDPRIASALCAGCAFDTSEQVPGTPAAGDNWTFTNYGTWDDPDPMASGLEANLIEAEALLNTPGSEAAWLAALNQLRTDYDTYVSVTRGTTGGTLAALVDPGTAVGRENLHFRERAFWLFSTGHRMSDLRRLVRQYGRAENTVWPTGAYWKPGANYGTEMDFPIADEEDNNPNFTGCTRGA